MLLTIFTPTYNRINTIERTFRSLCRQTVKDFEWLVVDDGSTDGTGALINEFKSKANFPVIYIKKKNGGKHTAYNAALEVANGKYFFTVDSDDWLCDDSLNIIQDSVNSTDIPIETSDIAGIIALKSFSDGKIIGTELPEPAYAATLSELEHNGYGGERSIILKTSIARAMPFPFIEGEHFMTESVVYDQIDNSYKFIVLNRNLTICEYQPDGLSLNLKKLMLNNPGGYMLYYSQRIDKAVTFKERISYILRYLAYSSLFKGKKSSLIYRGRYKYICNTLSPLGKFMAWYIRHLK